LAVYSCAIWAFALSSAILVRAANVQAGGLLSAYVSTLFLTLTNPMTILSFVAVFAGLGWEHQRIT
jgi:hypothetical protein